MFKRTAPTSIHIRRWRRHRRSRNWRVHSKMPGCCLLVAAAFVILFSVNWRCVNHVFHVREVFNSQNSHVWLEANPHALSVHCHQQHFAFNAGAGIVHDFWLGLTCYPTAQCTDLLRVSGRKATRNMCFQHEGAAAHFERRSVNISPPVRTISRSDEVGLWLGLPGHRDLIPMDFFLWDRIKILIYTSPVDSEENLVTLSLRQQQPSVSVLSFWVLTSISVASAPDVYRVRWPYFWTFVLNW
jgi:hypothetical protein